MAGLIKREAIDEVRSRTRIEDVVSQYVQLRPDGVDSQKGLCPFHDEKTPSFHIRPHIGRWHCFGCGEGGDVISFVERIEHVSFVEAVEILARKAGVELVYENNGRRDRGESGATRQRLIDAHRVAVEFYVAQLALQQGETARQMLNDRGFDAAAVERFKVGYSPNSWDGLLKELRRHGFTEREIAASGLASQGNRGLYDRFRGRLMWPIMSITGDPIGFGARKISDDDNGPKYLNTPETAIYKKSQVLYGLDMAKRAISQQRRIVVVEGYTDVMAAQLAGVDTAVATCGTAFGSDHVKIVRRLIGDGADPAAGVILGSGAAYGGEIIFTFDGDAAGQKAALKAFEEDQAFAAQTFVCVAPEGMDPCEVRMTYGDEAVRQIVAGRRPLFEFAIRSVLTGLPLNTAEGRTTGLRAAAPMVASIRDRVLRGEYTRQLAGWLGMDEGTVRHAVVSAARMRPVQTRNTARFEGTADHRPGRPEAMHPGRAESSSPSAGQLQSGWPGQTESGQLGRMKLEAPDQMPPALSPRNALRDPIKRVEREALGIYLQLPGLAGAAQMDELPSQTFTVPIHRRVHDAIRAAGGAAAYESRVNELISNGLAIDKAEGDAAGWYVQHVIDQADDVVARAVAQLAVESLPESRVDRLERYVWGIAVSLIRQGITRQIGDVRSRLQRTSPDDPQYSTLFSRLMELEEQRRACEAQIE